MTADRLAAAAHAADEARRWTEQRNEAIRAALSSGASLRRVAEATGLSHSAVAIIRDR